MTEDQTYTVTVKVYVSGSVSREFSKNVFVDFVGEFFFFLETLSKFAVFIITLWWCNVLLKLTIKLTITNDSYLWSVTNYAIGWDGSQLLFFISISSGYFSDVKADNVIQETGQQATLQCNVNNVSSSIKPNSSLW